MKAKLVYEAIGDIFKPKSEEEIMALVDDLSPEQLLFRSAESGFLPGVNKALEDGANVHYDDDYALRHASENGHYSIVKYLLDNGANVHVRDDWALRTASYNGYYDIVVLVLENGANIHVIDDDALRLASQYHHYDIVKILLDNGASFKEKALRSTTDSNIRKLLKKWMEKDEG